MPIDECKRGKRYPLEDTKTPELRLDADELDEEPEGKISIEEFGEERVMDALARLKREKKKNLIYPSPKIITIKCSREIQENLK